jgi:hypothetical protein
VVVRYEIKARVNKKTEERAQVPPRASFPRFIPLFDYPSAIEHYSKSYYLNINIIKN